MEERKRLVLIDGNAILHRAYHALPPLTTSKGELVNAVYGFCSMILKVRDELKPACFAVTFDLPKPTFRKKLYADYQSKRPEMIDELSGQIKRVKELVKILGIPIYEKAGFEADDVIGTLVHQAKSLETIVVTGDRDILQLVDEDTKVYMLLRGFSEATLFNEKAVEEKYGLKPNQIVDYKALVGDSSDNYPGIAGIGPKTAVGLLQKYRTLKGIYQNLDEIPGKVKEKLKSDKKNGELSLKLATIIKNVPVKLDIKKCTISDFTKPEIIKFFEEMEFQSLIGRLKHEKKEKKEEKEKNEEQMGLF